MKKLFFLLVCFAFTGVSFSQVSFEKGQIDLNFGVGFPNKTHAAIDAASTPLLGGTGVLSTNGDKNGSSTPFYNISADYGLVDNIGIGLYAAYFKSDSEILSTAGLLGGLLGLDTDFIGKTEYSVFSVGGKLSVHQPIFADVEKLDTYASTFLGYNFVSDDLNLTVTNNSTINALADSLLGNINYPTFTYEVNAGAKYDLSDNVAVFGEAGLGRFLANLGLTYHINKTKGTSRDNRPDARDY